MWTFQHKKATANNPKCEQKAIVIFLESLPKDIVHRAEGMYNTIYDTIIQVIPLILIPVLTTAQDTLSSNGEKNGMGLVLFMYLFIQ